MGGCSSRQRAGALRQKTNGAPLHADGAQPPAPATPLDVAMLPPVVRLDHTLAAALADPQSNAELKALFDGLDKDADGCVSSKEWGAAVVANQQILSKYFGGATVEEIGRQAGYPAPLPHAARV